MRLNYMGSNNQKVLIPAQYKDRSEHYFYEKTNWRDVYGEDIGSVMESLGLIPVSEDYIDGECEEVEDPLSLDVPKKSLLT